jgi:hypothetical protein
VRITGFHAENFKRLKAVDITPDANTVVIAGRNAQGKSSVLDGIMAAIGGKAGSKELVRPIRDGESKASVVVELDDLVVERKWTPSGSTVTVSPKGGNARLNSPQAVLDKLFGALSFDPLAFAEAEPKKQVDTLIDLIGREKFDDLAARHKQAYDERTEVNREVKSLRSRLDALGTASIVAEYVDPRTLSLELEAAIELERARDEWQRIEDSIIAAREQQAKLVSAASDVQQKVGPRPSGDVRTALANVEQNNEAARRVAQRNELDHSFSSATQESLRLNDEIESIANERSSLISSADLPVAGLSFDDEGVEYNGVPFVQASAAERLKVSVAMAMALNPELKVICIRDASLLDDESKQALVDMAVEHDYQIWYEVVGDGGEIGVIIEDGEVKA